MTSHRPTLMFGDDASPAADLAWLWINSHSWPDWRLRIVSAQAPLPGPPPPVELTTLHAWVPPQPRRIYAESEFAEVEQLTALLDPRIALSAPADLLVIGPRGKGMMKALHLGSTAHWLLARPPSPMLIARHGREVRTAVVCADGSAHADRALEALCAMPWVDRLMVIVLTIDDSWFDPEAAAQRAATTIAAAGADVEVTVRHRPTTASIMAALDELSPDLVVLGTRGNTGLRRLAVGSTANTVVQASSCSVLVACAEDQAEPVS